MSAASNFTAHNKPLIAEGSETLSGVGLPVAKKQRLSTASILAASVAHIPVVNPVETVVLKSTTPVAAGQQRINLPPTMPAIAPNVTNKATKAPKAPKVAKKDLPHVLIWVCHNGTRQGSGWTNHSLRIVGVYGSKAEAEQKKLAVMNQYEQCGHGDILVGGTCWDEIDLVIRPVGECTL
eukprot:gene8199-9758_t